MPYSSGYSSVGIAVRSLLTPEVSRSNPVIGNFFTQNMNLLLSVEKTKTKRTETGMGQFFVLRGQGGPTNSFKTVRSLVAFNSTF